MPINVLLAGRAEMKSGNVTFNGNIVKQMELESVDLLCDISALLCKMRAKDLISIHGVL